MSLAFNKKSFIWENLTEYNISTVSAPKKYFGPNIKLDVDTKDDLEFLEENLNVQHLNNFTPGTYDAGIIINKIRSTTKYMENNEN